MVLQWNITKIINLLENTPNQPTKFRTKMIKVNFI